MPAPPRAEGRAAARALRVGCRVPKRFDAGGDSVPFVSTEARPDIMRILVTGGAGFIGSHLVEGLVDQGWRVRVLDDLSSGFEANLAAVGERIEFVQGDVRDARLLARAVAGAEVVFHQAAIASVPLLPFSPPERARAWCIVWQVSTPKPTGTPCCCEAIEMPLTHSPAT